MTNHTPNLENYKNKLADLLKVFTIYKITYRKIPYQTKYLVPTEAKFMDENEPPTLAEHYTVNNEYGGETIMERTPIKVTAWQWLRYITRK